jgi:tRNA pseudouridine55 synthase
VVRYIAEAMQNYNHENSTQKHLNKVMKQNISVWNVYKPISKTPLEVVRQFRKQFPQYSLDSNGKPLKISYAGRLDPMAHGVLVLLVGEENKKREKYEKFVKEYLFQCIFGVATDTYDILGLVNHSKVDFKSPPNLSERIRVLTSQLVGSLEQPYPPYSAVRVNGKPLFHWAREGKLQEVTIPTKTVEVYLLKLENIRQITLEELEQSITSRIQQVTGGDFRQEQILAGWREVFQRQWHDNGRRPSASSIRIDVVTLRAEVSHGTYIRSLSHELGQRLGTSATVIDLLRTRVGEFKLENSVFWKRRLDDCD